MDATMEQHVEATEIEQTQYRWIDYLNIRVIEDTETAYINATKMCAMYSKTKGGKTKAFSEWYRQPKSIEVVKVVKKSTLCEKEMVHKIINGLDSIKGTYVHRDLVPHIALWCGITITDSVILETCIKQQNQVKRQKIPVEGFVYALSAPMFSYYGDNVYKIGYTENLNRRLKQFNAIPECQYVYTKKVVSIDTEKKVHALLQPFRLFDNKELFDVPLSIITESIDTSLHVSMSNIRTNAKKQYDK